MLQKLSVALGFILSLSACALAPGMGLDEKAAADRGRVTTGNESYKVEPITPALIRQLASEPPPPLEPDPLAGRAFGHEYRIAPYDVLTITVWDHPELTAPAGQFRSPEENGIRVGADGTIFYPYVGVFPVAGRTVAEVRSFLSERLVRVITNPQLDVRVAAYRGRKVQVTGEVVQPMTVAITDVPLKVQDAIAMARGFTPEADYANVTLSRDGRVHRIDLQALYERGDVSQNWLLQDGDVVNVGDRSWNKVFVVGEVRQQTARVMVKGRMTLAEALLGTTVLGEPTQSNAGFEPAVSDVGRIYVIRGDFNAPNIYKLDANSAEALLLATNFPLKPRDVVFVATYDVSRWARVLNQIVPTINSLWETYDIFYRTTHY